MPLVTAPPTSDFLTTMDPPERDITDQRQRFLEKNREAAYRCRQKKKKFINDLEERSELLKERNTQLQLQITLLKEESIFLRNLLLTHENCNCQGIVSTFIFLILAFLQIYLR